MRERRLALGGALAVIVGCAGPALAAGLVGGAALTAIRGLAPVAVILLGLVIVLAAARPIRRRNHRARSDPAGLAALSVPTRGTRR